MKQAVVAGTVIAAHGRQYRVELDCAAGSEPRSLLCYPRGKKSEVACGDRVSVLCDGEHGVIETVAPRRTLLHRSNAFRAKLTAANVTQVVIVVACEPSFSDELVTRCVVAAESQDMHVLIVLNKIDLNERLAAARNALQPFVALGYPVLELSARHSTSGGDALRQYLSGQTSVLVGQSGMGKSTLTNALIPEAKAATREISTALDSGKHTTTHATLYRLDDESVLIDSPGLQEFGLGHLSAGEIEHAFRELRPLLGQCRFRNCRHQREPDCAVRAAVDAGRIDARRHAAFLALCAEIV